MKPSPIVAIVGATATGKSALALALAKEIDAEIISADSRQVYRHLDIGTAKPTPAERASVPHHIVDVVDPDDIYSVARFRRDADDALAGIAERDRVALVVGGTGHYVEALLDRLNLPRVPPDADLRARLEAEIQARGRHHVLARLAALDPVSAERVDPSNPRRIIRALEVVETTGNPIPPLQRDPLAALWLGVGMDRRQLYDVADRRVDAQLAAGLIEETWRVVNMGYSLDLPSLNGLAYRQIGQYLRGDKDREESVAAYKQATHRLIRRQLTWFRANDRIAWLDAGDGLPLRAARERLSTYLRHRFEIGSTSLHS